MKRFDSINVIPFIDIMLVLLTIVLTTATFIAQGKLSIDLPEAESQTSISDKTGVEIAIDQDEALFYNEETLSLDDLRKRLAELETSTPIVLRVDNDVPFDRFVSVVDILKQYRLDSLSILTRAPGVN